MLKYTCVGVVEGHACHSSGGLPGREPVEEFAHGNDIVMADQPPHLVTESVNGYVHAAVAGLHGTGWEHDVVVTQEDSGAAKVPHKSRQTGGMKGPVQKRR